MKAGVFINRKEMRAFEQSAEIRKNSKFINQKKGREFNKISLEVEENFNGWLKASSLKESEFLESVKNDLFRIDYQKDSTHIITSFFIANNQIGISLICEDIKLAEFYNRDLCLFVLCFASKTNDDVIQKRFQKYLKELIIN